MSGPFVSKSWKKGYTNGERDRQLEILELFDRSARAAMKERISEEVIEEHRTRPQGPHSDDLARLLRYMRSQPMDGKLAVIRLGRDEYGLCRTSGTRGVEPTLEDDSYATADEAIHAVFVRRVQELET
jgi:branched-chain amino acid transport system permease protein